MSPGTKMLITGAAGEIGQMLTQSLRDTYDLVLTDRQPPATPSALPFLEADITDLEAMRTVCRGIDMVVHLAADRRTDAPWESLLPNNIIGTYNIFQAAQEAGCRRLLFASSVNTTLGYLVEVPVSAAMPVRPPNLYGASKVWGEALARFYADTTQLSCICLRFGWVKDGHNFPLPPHDTNLHLVLTYNDLVRLVIASIKAPAELRFGIFYGLSNNRLKQFDISEASTILGYEPKDDAFVLAEAATTAQPQAQWPQVFAWLKRQLPFRKKRG